MRSSGPVLAAAVAAALALSACGSSASRSSELRPPAPVVLSAAITPRAITVSPASVGAGPIRLVTANLTGGPQRVLLEPVTATADAARTPRRTGAIEPQHTRSLQTTLAPGVYRLRVVGGLVAPAILRIGPERPSSQNDLLLP
ncbi:unannotated protein [freshwater metagenome]|uniref:Unannotated protein n=1 Tax=freshwater metagenome TaxID=449393 RepID=A0A6J7HQS2_9ZZZZ|nr:hypothetical protein [Actinomycetota bacterium]